MSPQPAWNLETAGEAYLDSVRERLGRRLVQSPTGCLEWQGSLNNQGYGQIGIQLSTQRNKLESAHRMAWMLAHGEIPDGLYVCHRCDNRTCCNVDHLFLGTHQQNVADMVAKGRSLPSGPAAVNAAKTHCVRGHEFTPGNTVITASGARNCRTCRAAKNGARRRRKADEAFLIRGFNALRQATR